MKIRLIDVDSKIPNLALMQISSYYKSQHKKNEVGFHVTSPDEVWISCVFTENQDKAWFAADSLFAYNPIIHRGGSGFLLKSTLAPLPKWLPKEMQKVKPDYKLYPDMKYSLGFTTRGCNRNCKFCIVRSKEGKLQRWQHVSEFHDKKFDTIQLLDNNWLGDKDWFFDNSEWIIKSKLKVIENGLDVRLLDRDIAKQFSRIQWVKGLHFSFDKPEHENAVVRGIELLRNAGINIRSQVQFYILVGFDTTITQDKYRCRLLKKLGTNAFVMPYEKTNWTKNLARWANRKQLFWSCDIDDYIKGRT